MTSMEPKGGDITQRIGEFGKFQLKCFLLVQFSCMFPAWQILVSLRSAWSGDGLFMKAIRRTCLLNNFPIVSRAASCYLRWSFGAARPSWDWRWGRGRGTTTSPPTTASWTSAWVTTLLLNAPGIKEALSKLCFCSLKSDLSTQACHCSLQKQHLVYT